MKKETQTVFIRKTSLYLKHRHLVPWEVGSLFSEIPTSHSWLVFLRLSYLQRMKSELGLYMVSLVLYSLGCSGVLGATVQPDDAGWILCVGWCAVQSRATVSWGERCKNKMRCFHVQVSAYSLRCCRCCYTELASDVPAFYSAVA